MFQMFLLQVRNPLLGLQGSKTTQVVSLDQGFNLLWYEDKGGDHEFTATAGTNQGSYFEDASDQLGTAVLSGCGARWLWMETRK